MKVLKKIPQMDDNELSRLFANAIDLISRGKQVEKALEVKKKQYRSSGRGATPHSKLVITKLTLLKLEFLKKILVGFFF